MTEASDSRYRREVMASGATVMLPSVAAVTTAQSGTGGVQLDAVTTVPSSTSVDVTVYEDTTGDGIQDNSETVSLSGGTQTAQLSTLEGTTNSNVTYWIELSLSTSDTSTTPEVDSITLTLPEEQDTGGDGPSTEPSGRPGEPIGLLGYLNNLLVFMIGSVIIGGLIGLLSRSMAAAGFVAWLFFIHIAIQTSQSLFINILYVVLVTVLMGAGYLLVSFLLGGD